MNDANGSGGCGGCHALRGGKGCHAKALNARVFTTNEHEWTRILNHKTHKTHQNASPLGRQSAEGFV